MATKNDNWLMWVLGAGVIAVLGYFALGKTVNIQAGQAKAVGCGCGH